MPCPSIINMGIIDPWHLNFKKYYGPCIYMLGCYISPQGFSKPYQLQIIACVLE